MITLYHNPYSRAAGVVWTLEEVGEPYELVHVDLRTGAQKQGDVIAKNPMGKVPLLVDGDATVTEAAAIALYLADRYAHGRLTPRLDDPRRGAYFRWTLFAPSVIEPGAMAKRNGWEFRPGQAGWGEFDAMLRSIDTALTPGPFLLGDQFTIADVVFGGSIRYMTRFKLLEPTAAMAAYIERLDARPALQRSDARNTELAKAHGLI